ncbi:hypothetical protein SOVF_101400 [Spinacia oleracea]|uniref:Protein GOS9 n=1 Tax=Spinacia oleracea TaxID=3562 RepID=A0A9R0J4M3_SPIOL|nr:protein GOS9-like [Spinacia oleracea]KNA15091.1 hypothetical protein SOVF_101400 [Spinacia oleracea]
MAQLQKYGPYGSKDAEENFSVQLEDGQEIREIIIRHGFIVDAIGFTISGQGTSMYGGKGGNESKIVLKLGEFVTGISGQSGDTNKISKLRIHTSLNKRGYGPFGYTQLTKNVSNFSSPVEKGSNVVGFFGSALDNNLVSIGVYVEKDCGCNN